MKYSEQLIAAVKELYRRNMSVCDIARCLSMNYHTTYYLVHHDKVEFKLKDYHADARRKLTDDDVNNINIEYYMNGVSIEKLSEMYDVAKSTIRYHVDATYRQRTNERSKLNAHKYKEQRRINALKVYYKRKEIYDRHIKKHIS